MKKWRIPYVVLITGSLVASLLLVERMTLSRAISRERQELAISQESTASGPAYENAWKQLAAGLYEASHRDAALTEMLKRHDIAIHVNQPAVPAAASTQPKNVPSQSQATITPIEISSLNSTLSPPNLTHPMPAGPTSFNSPRKRFDPIDQYLLFAAVAILILGSISYSTYQIVDSKDQLRELTRAVSQLEPQVKRPSMKRTTCQPGDRCASPRIDRHKCGKNRG